MMGCGPSRAAPPRISSTGPTRCPIAIPKRAPKEHFYTNGTRPCPGAPHIYLSFPKRFVPERKKFADYKEMGVSDAVFLSSRDGVNWDRTFLEAWVRPGPDNRNWTQRSNMPAWGIVQLDPTEFSMYITEHYEWPDHRLRRITVRRHGFASAHAGAAGGEFTTRPLTFTGKHLILNYATSAAGAIQVEVQDAQGKPIEGRTLADMPALFGDELDAVVSWKSGSDLSEPHRQAGAFPVCPERRRPLCLENWNLMNVLGRTSCWVQRLGAGAQPLGCSNLEGQVHTHSRRGHRTAISQNPGVPRRFSKTQFNRRDAMTAEILRGIFSAFIASLRFPRASALVADWPRWGHPGFCSLKAALLRGRAAPASSGGIKRMGLASAARLLGCFIAILIAAAADGATQVEFPQLWQTDLQTFLESSGLVADLKGDGREEAVIAGREDLFALDGQGKVLWRWRTKGRFMTYPAVLVRPPQASLIYAADNSGLLTCLDGTGKEVWHAQLNGPSSWSASVVCDLKGDGDAEVIQTDETGTVWAFAASDRQSAMADEDQGHTRQPGGR